MDRQERHRLTKEVGLEALYRILRFTTGSEFLHYGLFEPDIPQDFQHFGLAQARYLDRLIETIPAGVETILDVGAGSGRTAEVLTQRGYRVDCVSPGRVLADMVEARLTSGQTLYRGRFEEVAVGKTYDLVLFSESFQYIPIATAMTRARGLLVPGGHILICDFFRKPDIGSTRIGGGHELVEWQAYLAGSDLKILSERDITAETAPLHDILRRLMDEVVVPLAGSADKVARARWPRATRFAGFFFRKDIEKLKRKAGLGGATGAEFRRIAAYRTYLLKTPG